MVKVELSAPFRLILTFVVVVVVVVVVVAIAVVVVVAVVLAVVVAVVAVVVVALGHACRDRRRRARLVTYQESTIAIRACDERARAIDRICT